MLCWLLRSFQRNIEIVVRYHSSEQFVYEMAVKEKLFLRAQSLSRIIWPKFWYMCNVVWETPLWSHNKFKPKLIGNLVHVSHEVPHIFFKKVSKCTWPATIFSDIYKQPHHLAHHSILRRLICTDKMGHYLLFSFFLMFYSSWFYFPSKDV